jgi:sugar phosphate isomerase/epimerase
MYQKMTDNSQRWNIRAKLAAQMYTVREHTKTAKDFADSLVKISKIGYPSVQLSAIGAMHGPSPEVTAKAARQMLDDNGLRCVATHRSWNDLSTNTNAEIDFHSTLGCDYTAIGGIPSEYGAGGISGYRQWVADALPIAKKLNDAGIRFGYHNHEYEFEKAGSARQRFYDIIVDEGNPDIMLEIDVYWIQHAGIDPVGLIDHLWSRLPVVHVKDKDVVAGHATMSPIGEGNLDWNRIIPALKAAGVEWYCVEQDDYLTDPFDCLRASYDYLSS